MGRTFWFPGRSGRSEVSCKRRALISTASGVTPRDIIVKVNTTDEFDPLLRLGLPCELYGVVPWDAARLMTSLDLLVHERLRWRNKHHLAFWKPPVI